MGSEAGRYVGRFAVLSQETEVTVPHAPPFSDGERSDELDAGEGKGGAAVSDKALPTVSLAEASPLSYR